MNIELLFPQGKLRNFRRRLYKMRSRTMDAKLHRAEEIVAVDKDKEFQIPIRCLDGVYMKDGQPTLVFVRA